MNGCNTWSVVCVCAFFFLLFVKYLNVRMDGQMNKIEVCTHSYRIWRYLYDESNRHANIFARTRIEHYGKSLRKKTVLNNCCRACEPIIKVSYIRIVEQIGTNLCHTLCFQQFTSFFSSLHLSYKIYMTFLCILIQANFTQKIFVMKLLICAYIIRKKKQFKIWTFFIMKSTCSA